METARPHRAGRQSHRRLHRFRTSPRWSVFFQPSEDRIVVLNDGDELGAYAELVYAHEYVHALQYGTYDIGALEEAVKDNADADRALTSLIEGDASLVQQRYFQQHLASRRSEIVRTLDSLPEGPDVPAAVTDSLIFPYVAGPRFVAALYRSGGWEAVDRAFSNPPQSTEQILHPDKYFTEDAPLEVSLPELEAALGDGWESKQDDVAGEFGVMLLLQDGARREGGATEPQRAGAATATPTTPGPDGAELIVMLAAWDSEGDARRVLRGLHRPSFTGLAPEDVVEASGAVSGVLRGAAHTILMTAGETLLIIATQAEAAEAARGAFPGFTSS